MSYTSTERLTFHYTVGISAMQICGLHFTSSRRLTNHRISLIYVFLVFQLKKKKAAWYRLAMTPRTNAQH